jgi:single-stranded-DNA-specific exonuclease
MQRKRWHIATPLGPEEWARFPDLPPLLAQLLYNRKVRNPNEVDDFLSGRFVADHPFSLKDMNRAITRLRCAIYAREQIAVYGDFDTDGVTATTLLVEALRTAGAHVVPYIPDRIDEGYGLNLDALRKLYKRGVRLVVTVDCGIRSIQEVAEAQKGLDMIITDHHTPRSDGALPPAVAVINPKRLDGRYGFQDLAGVGVAFKLAQALYHDRRHDPRHRRSGEAPPDDEALLDLVALGTVSDVVPLQGENRALVRRGLARINDTDAQKCRPGIQALMANAGIRRGSVDAEAIGFRLGPRLNAAGRIDSAMLAYRLLASREQDEAQGLAAKLGELNSRRQVYTEETVAEAEAQVLADDPDASLLLAASVDFKPGIVGLAASRLVDRHYRPAVVVHMDGEHSRGSCRSIPEFHITKALDRCNDLLVRHGGHAAAAGFTVRSEDLDALRDRLQSIAAEQLAGEDLQPTLTIDAEVPLAEVDWQTYNLLLQIEPCGKENPRPVLLSRGLTLAHARTVGTEGKHLQLALRDERDVTWDAIYFRRGDLRGRLPGRLDVAYTLGVRTRYGEPRLQLQVEDLRRADD